MGKASFQFSAGASYHISNSGSVEPGTVSWQPANKKTIDTNAMVKRIILPQLGILLKYNFIAGNPQKS
jgi:hypothetical protein